MARATPVMSSANSVLKRRDLDPAQNALVDLVNFLAKTITPSIECVGRVDVT
jgi:hypothetical protein